MPSLGRAQGGGAPASLGRAQGGGAPASLGCAQGEGGGGSPAITPNAGIADGDGLVGLSGPNPKPKVLLNEPANTKAPPPREGASAVVVGVGAFGLIASHTRHFGDPNGLFERHTLQCHPGLFPP